MDDITGVGSDTANHYFHFVVSVFSFTQRLTRENTSLQIYHAPKYEFKCPGPNKLSLSIVRNFWQWSLTLTVFETVMLVWQG